MIGIKLASGDFFPILGNEDAGAKRMVLTTVEDGQDAVHIELWRSPGPTMDDASYLASMVIGGIEPRPAQVPDIELLVSNGEDGRVRAQARDLSSGDEEGLDLSLTLVGPEDESLPDFEIDQEASFGAAEAVSDAFRAAGSAGMEPPESSSMELGFRDEEASAPEPENAFSPSLGPTDDLEIPDLAWDSGTEEGGEAEGGELAAEEPYPGYQATEEEEAGSPLSRVERSDFSAPERGNGYTQPGITTSPSFQVHPRERRMGAAAIILLALAGLIALAGLGYIVYRLASGFSWESAPDPADISLARSIASSMPTQAPSPAAAALASVAPSVEALTSPAAEAVGSPAPASPSPGINGSSGLTHKIRWGDTLWDISTRYYGTPWLYTKIASANSIRDPNLIISGRKLWIPPK